MPSRRRFLAASAATLTAAALPKSIFAEQSEANVFTNASLGAYTQGLLTLANFAKQVGTVFTVQRDDGSYGYMTLLSAASVVLGANAPLKPAPTAPSVAPIAPRISVNPVSAPVVTQGLTTFRLVFDVQGPSLPQQTYLLDHGTLGSFACFLVPGMSSSGGPTSSATFCELAAANTVKAPVSLPKPPIASPVGSQVLRSVQ